MAALHAIVLVVLLVALALALMRLRSLLAVAILSGAYSFIMAIVFNLFDAVDVAFTEASVGAGITLTLMLAAISLTARSEAPLPAREMRRGLAMAVCLAAAAGLVYATFDMPSLADPRAAIHLHVAPYYIERSLAETGVPNMVTAVLASYRGFDTLGEVTVIFTAGVSVITLLWRWGDPQS